MKKYIRSASATSYEDIRRRQLTPEQRQMKRAGQEKSDWPESNWWLSIHRVNDSQVNDLLADIEDEVLQDLEVYISVYRGDLQIADNRDNILAEMSEDEYIDNELQIASTCRGPKEFRGKYRNWIESLIS